MYRIAGNYRNIWDFYNFEPIVIFDDLRGSSLPYSILLDYLDKYKSQLKCRYSDTYANYTEVHITSVVPPEELYDYILFNRLDGYEQLRRRITTVVYHWKTHEGFHQLSVPIEEYTSYASLKAQAEGDTAPECNPKGSS